MKTIAWAIITAALIGADAAFTIKMGFDYHNSDIIAKAFLFTLAMTLLCTIFEGLWR